MRFHAFFVKIYNRFLIFQIKTVVNRQTCIQTNSLIEAHERSSREGELGYCSAAALFKSVPLEFISDRRFMRTEQISLDRKNSIEIMSSLDGLQNSIPP